MTWWLWILLGFILLLLELMSPSGFFLFFFGIAGILVGILTAFVSGFSVWMAWCTFAVLGTALMLLFRGRIVRSIGNEASARVDTMVGATGEVLEEMATGARGRVLIRGVPWSAENIGPKSLVVGDPCRVDATDGVVLKVQ
jgi:membrane protein implicated in regulation of membrane protease activity